MCLIALYVQITINFKIWYTLSICDNLDILQLDIIHKKKSIKSFVIDIKKM